MEEWEEASKHGDRWWWWCSAGSLGRSCQLGTVVFVDLGAYGAHTLEKLAKDNLRILDDGKIAVACNAYECIGGVGIVAPSVPTGRSRIDELDETRKQIKENKRTIQFNPTLSCLFHMVEFINKHNAIQSSKYIDIFVCSAKSAVV